MISVEVDDGIYMPFSSSEIKSIISERDSLINILNTKQQDIVGYSQSDIDAKDKTIRSLNSEISELRNQIKKQNLLINALNEEIGVN